VVALDAVDLRQSRPNRERVDMGLTISVDWERQHGFGYVLRVGNRNFTATTDLDVGAPVQYRP